MLYSFDDFRLDTDRRELRQGATLIATETKVFDLLEFLIRNRARVVSRDDLIEAIWEGRIVSESALSSTVNSARSAVGDSGKDQRLIAHLRGKVSGLSASCVRSAVRSIPAHHRHERPHSSNL